MMFASRSASIARPITSCLRASRPLSAPSQAALRRLLSSLAVLEHKDGKLAHSSLSAVTAAQRLGGSITAFVAGSGMEGVADEAAKVKGLEKVIYVENAAYDKVGKRGCRGGGSANTDENTV
jgi:electron transfer flavoprotein alpha subunit